MEDNEHLDECVASLETVIFRLAPSQNPIDALAQGRLEVALWAIKETLDLMGRE